MTDMRQLYQEVILDHNKKPRNFGEIAHANHRAEGHNPLCGDHIKLALHLNNDTIEAIAFEGDGCAICKASSSMMTVAVTGKTKLDSLQLVEEFRGMITGELDIENNNDNHLGKLKVFANIKTLPVRVKCAILPWHTLAAALNNQKPDAVLSVSTETADK